MTNEDTGRKLGRETCNPCMDMDHGKESPSLSKIVRKYYSDELCYTVIDKRLRVQQTALRYP